MSVKFCNISLRERLSYEHIADLPLQTLGFFSSVTLRARQYNQKSKKNSCLYILNVPLYL